MDGLSCASGVAAVVSITFQLVQGIHNLIEFWAAVKDAPKRVEELFGHLQLLAELLKEGRVAFQGKGSTNLLELSLHNCQEKVSKLCRKLELATQNSNSNNRYRRKWDDFKITFKDKEIQDLKNTIKEAHGLVQGAQITSLIHLTQENQYTSQKILAHVQANPASINLVSTNAELSMRIYETKHIHGSDSPKYESFEPLKAGYPLLQECARSKENTLGNHRDVTNHAHQAQALHTRRPNRNKRSQYKRGFFLYPPKILSIVGVSYGVDVAAICTAGWKYSLQIFRAVPENALIFEFCRDGNLAAVRTLLSTGHASPWDRDPQGRTPLYVAASSLNAEVVELLLREGADTSVVGDSDYGLPTEKWKTSDKDDMDTRIAIINSYLSYGIDLNYHQTLESVVSTLLQNYRPGAGWRTMSQTMRLGMVNRLLTLFIPQFGNEPLYMTEFLYLGMTWLYDKEVLYTILRHIPGMISDDDERAHSCIHEAITRRIFERDPLSARIITMKTKNLHRPFLLFANHQGLETPTTLAMFQSTLFFDWRKVLLEMGCKIEDFIERELKEEVVVNRGWTKTSLAKLFELDIVPYIAKSSFWSFPDCERCGHPLVKSYAPPIDLAWRRMLRSLRLGQSVDYYLHDDDSTASAGIRKLPYRIVCSHACDDGTCVSQGYENDLSDEPLLPPFREKGSVIEEIKPEDLDCPTRKMPGAFV